MDTAKINILLNRYQQGRASADEARLVESWLLENGSGSGEWNEMDELARRRYLSDLYNTIRKARLADGLSHVPPARVHRLSFWRIISSIAALFLLACGLYLTWPALHNWMKPVSYQVKTTARTPELLVLNDGSRVWLNSASSLRYPAQFTGDVREVYLEGEALFEVAHQADRPFLVQTTNLTTKVLGTVFTVQAYPGNAEPRIILKSGKVKVIAKEQDRESGVMLRPGQMVSYRKADGTLLKTSAGNLEEYSSWKDGKLIFNETPVPEVLQRVGRAYGVMIGFKDKKIKECAITGSFNVNQDLDDILKSISISVDGKFTEEAGQITLSSIEINSK